MATAPFTLQPVLSYKENLVDLFERQLAQLTSERRRLQGIIDGLYAQRCEVHMLLKREQQGDLHIERIQQHRLYADWLQERIDEQRRRAAELDVRIAAKRDELIATMQDKEMLARLKEKAEMRFFAHVEGLEEDLGDEIALSRYMRASTKESD